MQTKVQIWPETCLFELDCRAQPWVDKLKMRPNLNIEYANCLT